MAVSSDAAPSESSSQHDSSTRLGNWSWNAAMPPVVWANTERGKKREGKEKGKEGREREEEKREERKEEEGGITKETQQQPQKEK